MHKNRPSRQPSAADNAFSPLRSPIEVGLSSRGYSAHLQPRLPRHLHAKAPRLRESPQKTFLPLHRTAPEPRFPLSRVGKIARSKIYRMRLFRPFHARVGGPFPPQT